MRAFFVPFILSEGIFFLNLCFISMHNVLNIKYFQNMHTFTYQKTLFRTLHCLFLKPLKAFSLSLIQGEMLVRGDFSRHLLGFMTPHAVLPVSWLLVLRIFIWTRNTFSLSSFFKD